MERTLIEDLEKLPDLYEQLIIDEQLIDTPESVSNSDDLPSLQNLGERLLEGMTDIEVAQFLLGKIHSSEL